MATDGRGTIASDDDALAAWRDMAAGADVEQGRLDDLRAWHAAQAKAWDRSGRFAGAACGGVFAAALFGAIAPYAADLWWAIGLGSAGAGALFTAAAWGCAWSGRLKRLRGRARVEGR